MNYSCSPEQIQERKLKKLRDNLKIQKKREYNKQYKAKKEKENHLSEIDYLIALHNIPCMFTGKVGFILKFRPKKTIYTCNEKDSIPF